MSRKYDEYLIDHIGGVKSAFSWLCDHYPDISEKMGVYRNIIDEHDNSKYTSEEYDAYDRYFYGSRSAKVVEDFNYAWLHHIHHNPHHWQYWVLQHDDEPEEALEMPYWYVIEMICDWWSFSWKSGNLGEIFDWYEKHKDMKLHKNTRKLVEDILERIKTGLNDEEDTLQHYGILGQKWGVRRFQYADGTLTPAGKERYRKGGERVTGEDRSRLTSMHGNYSLRSYYKEDREREIAEDVVNRHEYETLDELKRLNGKENMKEVYEQINGEDAHIPGRLGRDWNCQNCAAAYELIQRGYDVSARQALTGENVGSIDKWFKDGELKHAESTPELNDAISKSVSFLDKKKGNYDWLDDPEEAKKYDEIYDKVNEASYKAKANLAQKISEMGAGARGILAVGYDEYYMESKKPTTTAFHALNFFVDKKGNVKVVDMQNEPDMIYDFSKEGTCDKIGYKVDPRSIFYIRTDNLELNPDIAKAVYSRK